MRNVRLPGQYFRVVVRDTDEATLRVYQQGTKTYSIEQEARNAVERFRRQGFEVKVFITDTSWYEAIW